MYIVIYIYKCIYRLILLNLKQNNNSEFIYIYKFLLFKNYNSHMFY